jgi:hypothetical protein
MESDRFDAPSVSISMRIAIALALLGLAAANARADASVSATHCPGVGIYPSRDGKSPSGPKWTRGELHLYSTANANDRYSLMALMREKHPSDAPQNFLLCLPGRQIGSGSGGYDDSAWTFEFNSLDRATADEVARVLSVPRKDRRPMGQGLRWRYRPVTEHVRVGEPLPIALTVENKGPDTVVFTEGGGYRGSNRENRYTFEIFKDGAAQPDIGNPNNFGGLAGYVTLAPGTSRKLRQVDLKAWGAFETPGVYEIHCHYLLDLSPSTTHRLETAHEQWELPADEVIRVEVFAR